MHDQTLVKALQGRRMAALAAVYDTYATSVYSYCHLLLGDRAAAEEALRDTFLIAELRIDDLASVHRLKGWLFAIARLEALRRRPGPAPGVPFPAPSSVGLRSMAEAAVAGLEADEREILELSLRHGLSDQDVAAVLQVAPRAVRTRVRRGRKRLRQALTAVILSRTGTDACRRLAGLTGPRAVLDRSRCRRIRRHARLCRRCKRRGAHRASLGRVLSLVAPEDMAPRLRSQVLSTFSDPSLISYRLHVGRRAGALGEGAAARP